MPISVTSMVARVRVANQGERQRLARELAAQPHVSAAALRRLGILLTDADEVVRRWAVEVLERLGPRAVDLLDEIVGATTHEDVEVVLGAIRLLGTFHPGVPRTIAAIIAAFGREPYDSDVHEVATEALITLAPASVPPVCKAMWHKKPVIRRAAAHAARLVAKSAPEVALPAFEEALTHPDMEVRMWAITGFEILGPLAMPSVSALRRLRAHCDARTARHVDRALKTLGVPRAAKRPRKS